MAANFEIVFIMSDWIGLDVYLSLLQRKCNNPHIVRISKIPDWLWSTETELATEKQLLDHVNRGEIGILEIDTGELGVCGTYIQKTEGRYVYSFWFNTVQVPELDNDFITQNNSYFYEVILGQLVSILPSLPFEAAAMGSEILIDPSKEYSKMIAESKNIVVWLLNKHMSIHPPKNIYAKVCIPEKAYTLWYRTSD